MTVGTALLLFPGAAGAWSGDTWANITRATIQANADQMIDSTWVPNATFTNYQYSGSTLVYNKGTTYTGVAYSQNNPQEKWSEFYSAVTTTSGGNVGYGNDCSGFTSICWKLPSREVTAWFESQIGTYWISLGDIGSAASAPLVVADALNSSSVGHIVMFLRYDTGGVRTMEQTPTHAQRKLRSYSNLAQYRPIRRLRITEERGVTVSGNLAFGNVSVGSSAQRTLTINSTGVSTLTVSNIALPAGFSGNWAGTIAAGGSQNVTITFTPTAAASYSGTLAVNSDAVCPTNTLSISGTGTSQAPQITAQPQSQTLMAGQSTTLSVTAAGSAPLAYQWQFYGTNLIGATTNSLALSSVTTNQSGPYAVRVTNSYGAVTSQVAMLTVTTNFQAGGWTQLWSLASGARSYLTINSLPYERGMAYNPATRRLVLVSRNGPHVYVLNADTGADIGELSVSGVPGDSYALLMAGVADDGAVYAGNLTTAGSTTSFKLYRWAHDNPGTVPTVAYSGDPGAGNNQRWGDTLDVRGAGANTQVILASRSGNVVAVLTTTNGTTFGSKLLTVADAPTGAFGLGIAFGANNTFWGKATSQSLRQVSFDLAAGTGTTIRNYASASFPSSVGPIGVTPTLNLLAGINVGSSANSLGLYDLTLTNGTPVFITSTNFATDNDNSGTGTGAVDFGGDRVYALCANNGLVALRVLPQAFYNPPPALPGRFDSICRLPGGTVEMCMSGTPTTNYILQVTSDWLTWTDLCTLSGGDGTFCTDEPCATNATQRFYRLRLAP